MSSKVVASICASETQEYIVSPLMGVRRRRRRRGFLEFRGHRRKEVGEQGVEGKVERVKLIENES